MSLHKLIAGSGYDYLTRHVAALDATEKGHTGLASYYAERDESTGVWIGSGAAKRIAALNAAIGWPADASIAAAVRTQVARELFLAEHGREPVNARELAGQIAKDSRPRTQTLEPAGHCRVWLFQIKGRAARVSAPRGSGGRGPLS
jgi:hypothetical protein